MVKVMEQGNQHGVHVVEQLAVVADGQLGPGGLGGVAGALLHHVGRGHEPGLAGQLRQAAQVRPAHVSTADQPKTNRFHDPALHRTAPRSARPFSRRP